MQVWAADKLYLQNNRRWDWYFLCLVCSGLAGYLSMQSKAEQTPQVPTKKKSKVGGSGCYYWCPMVVVIKKSASSVNLLLVLPETTNISDCCCKNSQWGADWHHVNVTLPLAKAEIWNHMAVLREITRIRHTPVRIAGTGTSKLLQ